MKEVEPHIWLVMEETEDYHPGWYFDNEISTLEGPFSSIEECRAIYKEFLEWLRREG